MNREQIEKWAREAQQYALNELAMHPGPLSDEGAYQLELSLYNTEFARLAWNSALDESKAKCIQVSERYMETDFYKHAELQSNAVVGASDCADAIDELKEPQT